MLRRLGIRPCSILQRCVAERNDAMPDGKKITKNMTHFERMIRGISYASVINGLVQINLGKFGSRFMPNATPDARVAVCQGRASVAPSPHRGSIGAVHKLTEKTGVSKV